MYQNKRIRRHTLILHLIVQCTLFEKMWLSEMSDSKIASAFLVYSLVVLALVLLVISW